MKENCVERYIKNLFEVHYQHIHFYCCILEILFNERFQGKQTIEKNIPNILEHSVSCFVIFETI